MARANIVIIITLMLILTACEPTGRLLGALNYSSPTNNQNYLGKYGLYNATDVNATRIFMNGTLVSVSTSEGVPYTGATDDVNLGGHNLTGVGRLIVTVLITGPDIVPATDNLYSLGNSTNWWASAYIHNIYSTSINTSTINSSNSNTGNMNVASNLTVGGYKITNSSGNMVVILV